METNDFASDESLNKLQDTRYRVLWKLYEISEGDSRVPQPLKELDNELGLTEVELHRTLMYLQNEKLVEKINMSVRITHEGVKEIEQSKSLPKEGTEHFSPTIIQHFNAPVGSVQNAPHSTAHVVQSIDARKADFSIVIAQINEEIARLPETERREASDLAESLVEQVESPQPRWATVKAIANGLGQFLSSTASSVLADFITKSAGG